MDTQQDAALTLEVAVLRCACGAPQTHLPGPCPQAERTVTEVQHAAVPAWLGRLLGR